MTTTPRKKKIRRTRSPHPGVVLMAPTGRRTAWRARWKDPEDVDGKRMAWERLDPLAVSTAEARREWAIRKARSLAKRRMDLASGAPRATGMRLARDPEEAGGQDGAIERYFKAHPNLAPRTLADYREAVGHLLEWARREGVESADNLTRVKLLAYREAAIGRPKRAVAKGGSRGARKATKALRGAEAVNSELRKVGTVLRYLHKVGLLPRLSGDDLRVGLERVKAPLDEPEFLRPTELRRLFEAALRHDAEVWAETREEHAGQRAKGTTPKYEPIAPFVATVLLSGMRFGEALALRWDQVDLEVTDAQGKPKGEIRLKAADTKTRYGRTVTLGVAPGLRTLLAALKLRAAADVYVFGGDAPMPRMVAEAARRRLVGTVVNKPPSRRTARGRKVKASTNFGAPKTFTWQVLRSSCATYQTNAPSLFGDAAAWASAKRLGHSVVVAERRYSGLFEVAHDARTLEAAMGIEDVLRQVIATVSGSTPKPQAVRTMRAV